MSKVKEILRVLFGAKQKEVNPVEVPTLDFHPQLLHYFEQGWVELVKGSDGEPYLIDGKRLYQIIDLENGLKQSRIVQLNNLFEQSKDFGMTSENVDYNLNLLSNINQGIADNRANSEEVLNLSKQMNNVLDGFKLAKQTKLGDDLIFAISALVFVFQNEDPSDFNEKEYKQRVASFRTNDLAFFFYTHSFKILSASLKVYMKDMQSFMKDVLANSLTTIKRQQLVLTEFLSTNSISLSEGELGLLESQVAMSNLRIKCLEGMVLNFTIGSLPSEN